MFGRIKYYLNREIEFFKNVDSSIKIINGFRLLISVVGVLWSGFCLVLFAVVGADSTQEEGISFLTYLFCNGVIIVLLIVPYRFIIRSWAGIAMFICVNIVSILTPFIFEFILLKTNSEDARSFFEFLGDALSVNSTYSTIHLACALSPTILMLSYKTVFKPKQ